MALLFIALSVVYLVQRHMYQVCACSSEAIWGARRLKPWWRHRILLAIVRDHSSLLFEKLFLRWAQSHFTLTTSWRRAISIPRQLWHKRWAPSRRSILRLRIRRCRILGFKPTSSLCSSPKSPRRLQRLIISLQMLPRLRHRIRRLMPHRSYLIGLLALSIDITMLVNISKVIILVKVIIIWLIWFLLIVLILLFLLFLILVLVLSPFVLADVRPILHVCFFNCFNFQIQRRLNKSAYIMICAKSSKRVCNQKSKLADRYLEIWNF